MTHTRSEAIGLGTKRSAITTNLAMSPAILAVMIVLLIVIFTPLLGQRFHASDPLWIDNDQLIDVSEEPEEIELSDLYDRFGHIFKELGDPHFSEAMNVNSLDEAPDSSWYTNRHAKDSMTIDELIQGANLDGPPSADEEWYVFRGKTQGITPGFQIEDSNGARFVIKFDPPELPELATAAEAIASRIFYALGFNVPQNYVIQFNPDNLRIKEGTVVADSFGDRVPLTKFRLNRMLRLIPRQADGKVRATASRYIAGKPIGPFRYFDTRSDDPNDVIPHEHRRELRGLRLFAAWTNHDDTRAQNTQDAWVESAGSHFIRHYLMDFGSTFGSGSVMIQRAPLGFSYSLDFGDMKYHAPRLGIPVPKYRRVRWPEFPKYKAVGRWEAEHFDPKGWKNDYPNPAFLRMTARDAFWAAKVLAKFTEEELLAIVRQGLYSDPENERYFHEVLVKRQEKCARFGINGLNPLDGFQVAGKNLEFTNLSEHYGFVRKGSTDYRTHWYLFDNQEQETGPTLGQTEGPNPEIPESAQNGLFLLAVISSQHSDHPHWKDPAKVYLRPSATGYEVVGIEREAPASYISMK